MHELSITHSILDISLKAAAEQHATRIRAIRLKIGAFSGVVPECVQMYLDVLAKGTIAEGAKSRPRPSPCGCSAAPAGPSARSTGGTSPAPPAAAWNCTGFRAGNFW